MGSTLETTRDKPYYDFDTGDRVDWQTIGTVTYGDKHVTIDQGAEIRIAGPGITTGWKARIFIHNLGHVNRVQIGLIDSALGTFHFRLIQTFRGVVEIEDDGDFVYIKYGNVKEKLVVSGTNLSLLYVKPTQGKCMVKYAWFSYKNPPGTINPGQSNVSITDFEAITDPQAAVLTDKKTSTITEAYGVNPVFDGQSSLHFESDADEHYSLDVGDATNIMARIRVEEDSHFTVGFERFMIEIDGRDVSIIGDGVFLEESDWLPAVSGAINVNFVKSGDQISCKIDLGEPENEGWTIGLFDQECAVPGTVFKIQNVTETNLYLDYILCGDQPWELFM